MIATSFSYDDYDFSTFIPMVKTFRPIYPNRENRLNGKRYLGYEYDSITLPTKICLRVEDIPRFKRTFAGLLHKETPKKLIFGNEQDKYYMAVIDEMGEIEEVGLLAYVAINWLVPDGFAHAIKEQEFTWDDIDGNSVAVESDFKGKVAGSVVENPNIAHISTYVGETLPSPSQFKVEVPQGNYKHLENLDGVVWKSDTKVDNYGVAKLLSWNVLEIVTRAYPELKGISDDGLRNILQVITINNHCMGSSPKGSGATVQRWMTATQEWGFKNINQTPNITNVPVKLLNQQFINQSLENGHIYILISADPSDGSIPSVVSIDYASVEITLKLPDGNLVTITSDGTHQTEVDHRIKFKGTTPYIAMYNEHELLQIGETNSIEGNTVPKKETIIYDTMDTASKPLWSLNTARIRWIRGENDRSRTEGSFNWPHGAPEVANFGPSRDRRYHGPSLSRHFKPLENWSITAVLRFDAMRPNITGRQEFNLLDADNNFVAGITFTDYQANANKTMLEIYVGDKKIYETSGWNRFYGNVNISKFGNNFYFNVNKTTGVTKSMSKSFYDEDIGSLKINHIDYWSAQWGLNNTANMHLTHLKLYKENVGSISESNIQFEEGDELFVDGADSNIYLNGELASNLIVPGSKILKARPGENEVFFLFDESSPRPDVTSTIRDKYL